MDRPFPCDVSLTGHVRKFTSFIACAFISGLSWVWVGWGLEWGHLYSRRVAKPPMRLSSRRLRLLGAEVKSLCGAGPG
jgi:hypothetical protein